MHRSKEKIYYGRLGSRVENRSTVRNVAKQMLLKNKGKSAVIILSIALTTFLFTALFTVGGSLLTKLREEAERQVGGSAMGAYKYLNEAEYESLQSDPKIKELSEWIYVGEGANEELLKLRTEVHWADELSAKKGFCYPAEGRMPEDEEELVMSDLVLEKLGVPLELGAEVPLMIDINGERIEKTFTLCGYFAGDHVAMSQVALVSKTFQEIYAPTPKTSYYAPGARQDVSEVIGRIEADVDFTFPVNIEAQLRAAALRCGLPENVETGVNWASPFSSVDAETAALVTVLLLVIMLSGYLIINNIYYINVYADIRGYGLLKTIGMSGRQLQRLVRQQAAYLSVPGILLGMGLGVLTGAVLLPAVMAQLTFHDTADTRVELSAWILLFSALFSYLTVRVSCRRPAKMASGVTPVEAVRYTEGTAHAPKKHRNKAAAVQAAAVKGNRADVASQNKQKNALPAPFRPARLAWKNVTRDKRRVVATVLSLSLSLVVLNSVYSLVSGFDEDKFIGDFVACDFAVMDATLDNAAIYAGKNMEGVTEDFLSALSEQGGIEAQGNIYIAENEYGYWWIGQNLPARDRARLRERVLENPYYVRETASFGGGDDAAEPEIGAQVYGMDPFAMAQLTVRSGEIDETKLSTGKYIIVNEVEVEAENDTAFLPYFLPGETVTVTNANGETRDYEVLATVSVPYAIRMQVFSYPDILYFLPTAEFQDFFGVRQPMRTVFNADDAAEDAIETWLATYTETAEPRLTYSSREVYREEFREMTDMMMLIGVLVTAALAMIGILNLVNLTVTSILSRRIELAMLEAVGMTKKTQLRMICMEGLCYALLAGVAGTALAAVFSAVFVRAVGADMWYFTWHFTLMPVLLLLPAMLIVTFLIPYIVYHVTMKDTVVERLRVAEV